MSPEPLSSGGPTPPLDPDLQRAHQLLGDTLHEPVRRAQRIAGLYAALYLEDPLLHQWGGLASFVARHVHEAMEGAAGMYEAFMAEGNLVIYEATMPAFLRLRDGRPAHGPLRHGFALLARADRITHTHLALGERVARRALSILTRIEQVDIVQPAYDRLGRVDALFLAQLMRFRMGWDTAAPVIDFDGSDGRVAHERLAWANDEVLPAWHRARDEHPAWLRGDIDRVRRWAGVRMDDLPPRRHDPVG